MINFAFNTTQTILMEKQKLNRIKIVLGEKKRTSRWLAQTVGRDPASVSKWCTNSAQPDLYMLKKVADLLDVDIRNLICKTKE